MRRALDDGLAKSNGSASHQSSGARDQLSATERRICVGEQFRRLAFAAQLEFISVPEITQSTPVRPFENSPDWIRVRIESQSVSRAAAAFFEGGDY